MRIESNVWKVPTYSEIPRELQPVTDNGKSTIITLGAKGFSLRETYPFRLCKGILNSLWAFVRDYLLCCCFRTGKINWQQTREVFSKVYTEVVTSIDFPSDRQKRFNESAGQLSTPAMLRFKEYVAYAYALVEKEIHGRDAQEKWAKEHSNELVFKDYFQNVNSSVLKVAVEGFWKEIIDMTTK